MINRSLCKGCSPLQMIIHMIEQITYLTTVAQTLDGYKSHWVAHNAWWLQATYSGIKHFKIKTWQSSTVFYGSTEIDVVPKMDASFCPSYSAAVGL